MSVMLLESSDRLLKTQGLFMPYQFRESRIFVNLGSIQYMENEFIPFHHCGKPAERRNLAAASRFGRRQLHHACPSARDRLTAYPTYVYNLGKTIPCCF